MSASSTNQRCPTCDRPLPTTEMLDESKHPPPTKSSDGCTCAACLEACFALAWGEPCHNAPVDWRRRALDAEHALRAHPFAERIVELLSSIERAAAEAEEALGRGDADGWTVGCGRRSAIVDDLLKELRRSPPESDLPWNTPALRGWSIVGMNHYRLEGRRRLFVSMTKAGRGLAPTVCITAEGPNEREVFESLAAQAEEDA